eukprot:10779151-Ditylum_brightwellii.AAC.1
MWNPPRVDLVPVAGEAHVQMAYRRLGRLDEEQSGSRSRRQGLGQMEGGTRCCIAQGVPGGK